MVPLKRHLKHTIQSELISFMYTDFICDSRRYKRAGFILNIGGVRKVSISSHYQS